MARLSQRRTDLGQRTPTGTIKIQAGTALPTGWLWCDGAEYDEVAYASLFAIIGTAYNTGGETAGHFRVPDARGEFIRGLDDMGSGARGVDTGRALGSPQTDQLGAHTHPSGTLAAPTQNAPHFHPTPATVGTGTAEHNHNITRGGTTTAVDIQSGTAGSLLGILVQASRANFQDLSMTPHPVPHNHPHPSTSPANASHAHPSLSGSAGATGGPGSGTPGGGTPNNNEQRPRNLAMKKMIKI